MRLLLVEDEQKLTAILSTGFKAEGFAVDVATTGSQGLDFALTYAYDIIILDIMLPDVSGTEILTAIRARTRAVPILMLTAKDAVVDKVRHMELGADDYLTKPFAFSELLVRVRALLRRAPVQRTDEIRIADLEINRMSRQVKRAGRKIELSAKEFALLEYLAMNAGRVLSRTMIVEHVWDQSFEGLTNIVDVYVRQLRAKIDEGNPLRLVKTVRGSGYLLSDEPG